MADAPDVATCVGRYSRFRDLTVEYEIPFHRYRLARLASRVRLGERVLDVGCNAGYLQGYLPGHEVYGVDPSVEAVRVASERLASAQVGSAESLPFPDRSFDVVVLGYIVERVFDPVQVIAEARRVARRLIVGDTPHQNGPWGPRHVRSSAFDVRCYDAEGLLTLLAPAGQPTSIEVLFWRGVPAMYSFAVEV